MPVAKPRVFKNTANANRQWVASWRIGYFFYEIFCETWQDAVRASTPQRFADEIRQRILFGR